MNGAPVKLPDMVRCACRATSWGAILQALVQVHQPHVARPVTSSLIAPPSNFRRATSRAFTTSRCHGQEAALPALGRFPKADRMDHRQTTLVADANQESRREQRPSKTSADGSPQAAETSTERSEPGPAAPPSSKPKDTALPKNRRSRQDKSLSPPTTVQNKPQPRLHWQDQKKALKEKFPDGWRPRKRLSPDALAGIRALNAQFPDVYTTRALADKFEVSAESIRRILKSNWTPSAEEEQERQERWFRRGKQVWERKAAVGVKPPRKWRREGIVRDVAWHERRSEAVRMERRREEQDKEEERARRARSRGDTGQGV